MSKQPLPKGHPLAQPCPAGVSPFDLADQIVAYRRGFSGPLGMQMKDGDPDGEEDPDEDGDDPDDEVDPDATVKVGDKVHKVSDLQTIMAREKRQGRRAGQRQLAEELGFDSVEALKAAVAASGGTGGSGNPPSGGSGGSDDGDAAAAAAAQREAAAAKREAEAAKKARRADLRGALREAGVDRADLDDAFALLDGNVDTDYDDDELEDAVEALKARRPSLFGDDDGDGDTGGDRPAPRAALPPGGRRRQPRKKQVFGAGGIERAQRKGWVKQGQ